MNLPHGTSQGHTLATFTLWTQAILLFAVLLQRATAQSNVYSVRVVGHTPFYERIFHPKGSLLRPPTLRGLDDLGPRDWSPETNRIDRIFADLSRERTTGLFSSCLSEVPMQRLTLRCPGGLLDAAQVQALLRDAVAIPRSAWTNQMTSRGVRYVFSLEGGRNQKFVIDERPGAFALVFFPDDTYRCVVGPGYGFMDLLRKQSATSEKHLSGKDTNQHPRTPTKAP